MFWGLLLEPGKRYSTTVEKSFHVSKAALDCSSVRNENEILSVILETEGSEALLCNLCKQRGILQETLDLSFMSGDRLTFECRGHGRIHLTGYLLPDEDDISGMMGDEESEEDEESGYSQPSSPEKTNKGKRKPIGTSDSPLKKIKTDPVDDDEEESDSEIDEESDMSDAGLDDEDLDDEEVEGDDSDKNEDEESDEEEDDEEDANLSQKKKHKQQQKPDKNKTPNKQNLDTSLKKTPVTNGISPKDQKSNKKTPGGNKSPNATPQQRKVLDQGVIVKELKVGTGAPAKPGRTVSVYYVGKLKESGKVFDKCFKGEGFKFKLGKGEVIKGWDIGLQGMKVGGKRIVHCPPEAAYGVKGVPPKIPANSTLTFEVELKNVH